MKARVKPINHMLILFCLITSYTLSCKKDKGAELVKDYDGNVYHTVKIGDQTWMVENLKVSHLNDGTAIPELKENDLWANADIARCWYNNDAENQKDFGALYNWKTVATHKLAPKGWHVATKEEWDKLAEYLGGADVAGGKLKEKGTEHWNNPNIATNESGFSALGGGMRDLSGNFMGFKLYGYFWTPEKLDDANARAMYVGANTEKLSAGGDFIWSGFSVRCIKD